MSFWKVDLRSRSWPDRKRSCCILVDPYGRPEHICGVFIALAGLYQKLLPKNCWWPFMTWNDFGDMTGEGSLVAIFRLRLSSLPVTRVFRMVFFQKRCLSHWLIIERSQNWPDPGSWISKFRAIHFIDTSGDWYRYQLLKVSRWSGIWCSYDDHANFFWGEVTWRDQTMSDLGLKFSHVRKRCMNRYAKNGGCFLDRYLRKTWRRVFKYPPARRGLIPGYGLRVNVFHFFA